MLKGTAIALLGASVLSTNVALAENNYAGGNIVLVEYSENGVDDDASLVAVSGRLGSQFNEYLSAELRVGFGVQDDSVNVFGTSVNLEIDSVFGAYFRGGFQASESFYPYAVAGYSRAKLTASALGSSFSDSENDVSFGVGADIDINEKLTLNLEYMNYLDKGAVEINGLSFGIVGNF